MVGFISDGNAETASAPSSWPASPLTAAWRFQHRRQPHGMGEDPRHDGSVEDSTCGDNVRQMELVHTIIHMGRYRVAFTSGGSCVQGSKTQRVCASNPVGKTAVVHSSSREV